MKDQLSPSAFFQQARARRQSGNGTARSIVVCGKSLGFKRHHFFVLQQRLETDCKDSAERKQDRKLRLSFKCTGFLKTFVVVVVVVFVQYNSLEIKIKTGFVEF